MGEKSETVEAVASPCNEEEEGAAIEVISALGELGPGALITEGGLARLFGRHPTSVKRAVDRGELPPPVRVFGKPVWTAATIVRHIQGRLDAAAEERDRVDRRLSNNAV